VLASGEDQKQTERTVAAQKHKSTTKLINPKYRLQSG